MQGKIVSLRPLQVEDSKELWDLIWDDYETWRWVGSGFPIPTSEEDLRAQFAKKLDTQGAQHFAILDLETQILIGATSFLDIRPNDRHLEIGSTFIAPAFRGGNRNVETKLLMLNEAFENRGAVRITFKANADNQVSRRAIEKVGAKFEGLLRNQRLERDGSWRTAAYYSVIVEEWPETKQKLLALLNSI